MIRGARFVVRALCFFGRVKGARSLGVRVVHGAVLLAAPLVAQRATVRSFDVGDGLPSNRVSSLFEDSRGFLWIATWEGLARFDGTRFDAFGPEVGLPRCLPNEVREDRRGRIWVALNGEGIARLLDEPSERGHSVFRTFRLGSARRDDTVNALYFDDAERLWLGTESGLARATERADGSLDVEFLADSVACLRPQAACATDGGALWFLGSRGLACVRAGVVETSPLPREPLHPEYLCLAARSAKELLVADDRVLWSFDVATRSWAALPLELAANQGVRALLVDGDDVWIGTTTGLIRVRAGEPLLYTTDQGLPDNSIRCALRDRAGRLWFGTWLGGVAQFGRSELASWTRSPEMPNPDVTAIAVARDGRIVASTINDGLFALDERGARRFGTGASPLFDRVWTRYAELAGVGWLLCVDDALYVALGAEPDLAHALELGPESGCDGVRPICVLGIDGSNEVVVADASGRLLDGRVEADGRARFTDLLAPDDRRRFDEEHADPIRSLARSSDGTLWLASRYSLARLVGRALEFIEATDGLPTTEVRDLLSDPRGRLWVALRHDGVSRCDEPSARTPKWSHVDALAGEQTFALAAGRDGRVWVGSWRGVHELDEHGAVLRRFTHAGGLASDFVNALAVDAEDRVWVATSGGVTRLDPRAHVEPATPPVAWIARVEVDGEPLALAPRGAREVGPLELDAGHDTLLIAFGAPWLASDEPLLFQLRLAGVDSDWSKPQSERQVRFARLAPGDYRLLVRAVLGSSARAGEPAALSFSIPPPLWRSPWVVALGLALFASLLFAWHRLRLRQALALERVRSQIALDLHDELGADLTQVAILAEVARRETPAAGGDALERVAGLARDMRESLADIVWSVDPRRDKVGDLAVRLRQVGNQLVESGGVEFALAVDSDRAIDALAIAPDERRALYLIAKESLHNAVKHARAKKIDVALRVRGSRLDLAIRDDGRGFDPEHAHTGHGLRSLRSRAASLGANLALRSELDRGTSIELAMTLRGPA
ncbi:MAG: hypothetical protein K8S98_13300 [Planctomycetes bacterium]|nr:hypothetical protein [Planctomycetota bacterium]